MLRRVTVVIGLQILLGLPAFPQGFGKIKRKITLHRRLPSAKQLTGGSFKIKTTSAANRTPPNFAEQLSAMLGAELMKFDSKLHQEEGAPDILISCTITNLSTPAPVQPNRRPPQQKNKIAINDQTVTVSGSLNVSYQARDLKANRTIDSSNVTATVSEQVDAAGSTTSEAKKIGSMAKKPLHLISKKKDDDNSVNTPEDVQQLLLKRAVAQIAARLVNTNETIEVYLARGKLDDYNKAAEAGLWDRVVEPLETMTPFPKKEDDAYRLYNLGVAYEARAYGAEDMKTAKKFFDQAAINYGKAIDDNPGEKYFLDPQTRIQTALAQYKKLEAQQPSTPVAPPAAAPAPRLALAPKAPTPSSGKAAANGALTNAKLIQLVKAGLDEDNLLATIRAAPAVNFDLSADGQLALLQAGVKPKVIAAMRDKMNTLAHPTVVKTSTAQSK